VSANGNGARGASGTSPTKPANGNGAADGKRKVAVLGAGPAGLAAAFALTRTPELRARYAVTVYQMGWRAGGKSSTGRAMDKGWRIEQNGSHYLFGCYGNSFALVRQAYEVLEEHGVTGFGTYREQFVPRNLIATRQDMGGGEWESWFRYFPETTAWPDRGGKYPPPSHFFFVAVQLLLAFLLGLFINTKADTSRSASVLLRVLPLSPFHADLWARLVRALALGVGWIIDGPLALVGRGLGAAGGWLAALLPPRVRALVAGAALRVADGLLRAARAAATLADPTPWCWPWLRRFGPVDRYHRLRVVVELGTTAAIGVIADRLWEAGRLEAIDGLDFRAWLRKHGASDGKHGAVESPLVKVWYDAVVAYEDGDEHRPRISAGVTLHALFRAVVTYKGAFAYQMTHEIGDCFIAPIVRALQLRGVDLRFFHRVRDVVPGRGEDADLVDEIVVEEQIPEERRRQHRVFVTLEPTGGRGPLEARKVWPNRPVFEDDPGRYDDPCDLPHDPPLDSYFSTQAAATRRLRRGADFHEVVFALPLGIVKDFPGLRARPGWAEACENVKSVATQSMRLWFRRTLDELGWSAPGPILSGFAYPYSTWEDNSQNCGSERFGTFGTNEEPQAIATLFGPLTGDKMAGTGATPAFADTHQRLVEKEALRFYEQRVGALWPALEGLRDGKFAVLLAPSGCQSEARFAWQYTRANVGPLESYVLALPGTLRHRLRPDETGFRNMYVAGEWTRNGFEVGCVEGAVISGLAAAQALSRRPLEIVGHEDLTFGPFRRGRDRLPRPRRPRVPTHLSA
jgi:uncharacterized protein with NAD-binding domain and iron-sulfur cluster